MNTIKLRATRPMHADGRRHEVGDVLQLPPMLAGLALDSGRAELVNADDRQAITAARQADGRQRQAIERRSASVGTITRGPGWW